MGLRVQRARCKPDLSLKARVLVCGVEGLGFKMRGSEFRGWDLGSGLQIWGLGFKVQGFGARV